MNKSDLKKLIAGGKLRKAFELIMQEIELISDKDLQNSLIVQSGNLQSLIESINDQTIGYDSANITHNQIAKGLLRLIDDINFDTGFKTFTQRVITVMGTKGGTGKSSIIIAIAELLAASGKHVAIIDADTESSGITKYLAPRLNFTPNIISILEAAYQRHTSRGNSDKKTKGINDLWDVTPSYLRKEKRFGSVFLIPGRLKNDIRNGFEAFANIDLNTRNKVTLEILEEQLIRINKFKMFHFVLIDSGAENNPLVSAGFVKADYGFIVSPPHPKFKQDISRLNKMHQQRYPEYNLSDMNVLINMATFDSQAHWPASINIGFIPKDTTMHEATLQGGDFDFEGVGFNKFYHSVLMVLNKFFTHNDKEGLPDEGKIWIRPFLQIMKDSPEMMLRKPEFRFLNSIAFIATILVLVVSLSLSIFLWNTDKLSGDSLVEVEIQNSNEVDTNEFLSNIQGIEIPKSLSNKIWIDSTKVVMNGELFQNDLDLLKKNIPHLSTRDAIIEAFLINNDQFLKVYQKKAANRQTAVVILVIGVIMFFYIILNFRKYKKRQKLLRAIIIAKDSDDHKKLNKLIKKMLENDPGKPQLLWLRNEFRNYSPNLDEFM